MSDAAAEAVVETEPEVATVHVASGHNGIVDLVNVLADRADPLIKIATEIATQRLQSKRAESRYRMHMSWIAVILVGVIVAAAAFLTYLDKVDGSTFTFLLGLTIGYLLTFIRDAIEPNPQ